MCVLPRGIPVFGVDDRLCDHPVGDGLLPDPVGSFLFFSACMLACGGLFFASFTFFISLLYDELGLTSLYCWVTTVQYI